MREEDPPMMTVHHSRRFLRFVPLFLLALVACDEGGSETTAPPPPQTGSLNVTVTGVPDGISVPVTVSGPQDYSNAVQAPTVLSDLVVGTYSFTIAAFGEGDAEYTPIQEISFQQVVAGTTRDIGLAYTEQVVRGSLAVGISGLPTDTPALVTVDGPNGYEVQVTASETLEGLEPGSYHVQASVVAANQTTYEPFPVESSVSVVAGNEAAANFAYGEQGSSTLDLYVVGYQFVQSTQREENDVPLVRDRSALLRVYGIANEPNITPPNIRAEFFINGTLEHTEMLFNPGGSVPTSIDRTDLDGDWLWEVPASLIQPNLSLRLEIDPANDWPEQFETNNRYPLDGDPDPVDVVSMAPLQITLVPVVVGQQGNVSPSNADDYISDAKAMYPFPDVEFTVRSAFTPSVSGDLVWNDSNYVWHETLEAVLALRNGTDQSDDYYYGVVATDYNSGVAGLGYIPFSRTDGYNAAIGWDKQNSRAGVLAHELGHNLGRQHSPCGGAAGTDPNYPVAGASIIEWGYDPRSDQLLDPAVYTDIMGYCNPQWISDYTFERVLAFMGGTVSARALPPTPCLMVWGSVIDGEIRLRPAFQLEGRPLLPSSRGDYTVEAHDAEGHLVFRFSFDPVPVGDHPRGDVGSFAWMVPLSLAQADAVAQLSMSGRGRRAERVSERAMAKAPRERIPYRLLDLGGDRRRVEWDAQAHPMLLVRDPRSDEVVAFARGGDFEFLSSADELELLFSDGVQSLRMDARVD